MAADWRSKEVDVRKLSDCVTEASEEADFKAQPETEFTLIRVTYDGKCEIDKKRLGKHIRAKTMYRVKEGQLVFSKIRSTDGAMGIVPKELDGALVSGSYVVFDCGTPEETAYLWAVLRSHEERADMQSLSTGAGSYVTSWPEVGEVLVPWLKDNERRSVGASIIESWKLEKDAQRTQNDAFAKLDFLGIESESIRRWKAVKAPT